MEYVKFSLFCPVFWVLICAAGISGQICDQSVDLTVIIDSSNDITAANFDLIRNFLLDLMDSENLRITFGTTRVNFLQYAENFVLSGNYLTSNRRCQTFLSDMSHLSEVGRDTAGALDYFAASSLSNDRSANQNVVLLLVTGPSDDKESTITAAERLHTGGDDLLVIGVGQNVDVDEIKQVTSPPRVKEQNYFLIDDYTELDGNAALVASGLCNRDVPAPATTSTTVIPTTTTAATEVPVPDATTTVSTTSTTMTTLSTSHSSSLPPHVPSTISVSRPGITVTYVVGSTEATSEIPGTTEGPPMDRTFLIKVILVPLLCLLLLIILVSTLIICCCCRHRSNVDVESCCGLIHCTESGANCLVCCCSPCCRISENHSQNSQKISSLRFSNIKSTEDEETVKTPLTQEKS